ncbi:HEAT repeat domain-containing protein [Desulfobacter latus]|uniref:HEAT repeat domain-containing protein n=1 Tax=Desulfobacter latus TaxID=2292 RepID=A0A850SZW2_9BACT|nr:HEAT repeat domain-containing protein [Desulfobacter latus]NWH05650.1 HEAT repeat domain-containing protein [Desulfobacter latus]
MKKLFQLFFISLGICAAFFFLLTTVSNRSLYYSLTAGGTPLPPVPNALILPTLLEFDSALLGSLFFTLTAGILISLCICVIFVVADKRNPIQAADKQRLTWLGITLTLSVLLLLIMADTSVFHRIRDYLLLPNALGRAFTRFYYTYSPYAVTVLKPYASNGLETIGYLSILYSILGGLCRLGLIAAAPLFIFISLYYVLAEAASLLFSFRIANCIAALFMVVNIAGTLVYLYPSPNKNNPLDITALLYSNQNRYRVEGLRRMYKSGIAPRQFQRHLHNASTSPFISERYWAAKVLSKIKTGPSIRLLQHMTQDRAIATAAAAAGSLAEISCSPATIAHLKRVAENRPEWYIQAAAVKGIRKCRR